MLSDQPLVASMIYEYYEVFMDMKNISCIQHNGWQIFIYEHFGNIILGGFTSLKFTWELKMKILKGFNFFYEQLFFLEKCKQDINIYKIYHLSLPVQYHLCEDTDFMYFIYCCSASA